MDELTKEQKHSISNYKRLGIDIEILGDNIVKIIQLRLINRIILNQKELHERAREIFLDKEFKIFPVVILPGNGFQQKWTNTELKEKI